MFLTSKETVWTCGWMTRASAIAGAFLELSKAGVQFVSAEISTPAAFGSSRTPAGFCGPRSLTKEAEGFSSGLHDAQLPDFCSWRRETVFPVIPPSSLSDGEANASNPSRAPNSY